MVRSVFIISANLTMIIFRYPTPAKPSSSGGATFVRDGGGIMDRKSYAEFLVASFFKKQAHYLQQSDPACRIEVDLASFFDCFTYVNEEGKRMKLDPAIIALLRSRHSESLLRGSSQDTGLLQEAQTTDEEILQTIQRDWQKELERKKALTLNTESSDGKMATSKGKGTSPKRKGMKSKGKGKAENLPVTEDEDYQPSAGKRKALSSGPVASLEPHCKRQRKNRKVTTEKSQNFPLHGL